MVGVAEQIREIADRHCGVFEVMASTVAPHIGHDVLKAEALRGEMPLQGAWVHEQLTRDLD